MLTGRIRQPAPSRSLRGFLVAVLASALLLHPQGTPAVVANAVVTTVQIDGPPRLLLLGDSVTHGSDGDYTWRYRLWKHMSGGSPGVDLVGPRDDLFDRVAQTGGSQAYVDPAFDRDHASRWGATLAFPTQPVAELVRDHRPDVVVEMLGVNDLLFLDHTPDRVVADVAALVADVRSVDPDVDVVLGQLTQTWFDGVPEVNAGLDALAVQLDDPRSRVVVARAADGYDLDQHAYDDAHANARGELLIAAAVADALSSLAIGAPYPRPLPPVPTGPRTAPTLTGRATSGAVDLVWNRVPGVDTVQLWIRDTTADEAWTLVTETASTQWHLDGLLDGHRYVLRLRPAKGRAVSADIASEVVLRPAPPSPGPVRDLRARSPRRDVVVVAATAVTGATSYDLQVATVRRCWAPARFRTVRSGLARPSVHHGTRADLVRVRLQARNLGGIGPVGRSVCVRVR